MNSANTYKEHCALVSIYAIQFEILTVHKIGERTGLVVRASDSGSGTRVRSSAGSVYCFLEQETFTPQKVLVIPRNRWLRLNMTEKLFTGTLNKNQNKSSQDTCFKLISLENNWSSRLQNS